VGVWAREVHRLVAVVPVDAIGRLIVGAQDFEHDAAAAPYVQRRGLDYDLVTNPSMHSAPLCRLGCADPAGWGCARSSHGPDGLEFRVYALQPSAATASTRAAATAGPPVQTWSGVGAVGHGGLLRNTRISTSLVADAWPISRTSPDTCWKIRFSSRSDMWPHVWPAAITDHR
jgi:hypothetical protein